MSFHLMSKSDDKRKVGNSLRSTGWESLVYTKVHAMPGKKPNEKRKNANLLLCMATYRSLITVLWSGGYTFRSIMSISSQFVIYRHDRKEIGEERFDMSAATRLENYCAKYRGINASSSPFPHVANAI